MRKKAKLNWVNAGLGWVGPAEPIMKGIITIGIISCLMTKDEVLLPV